MWLIMLAVSLVYFRLLSTRILVTTQLHLLTSMFSLIVEASEEEQYVGVESVNEEEQDQGYFVDPGKPPYQHIYTLLFYQACFVFKIK